MRRLAKLGAVGALAIGLVAGAAALNLRSETADRTDRPSGPVHLASSSSSTWIAAAGGGALDDSIAALRERLRTAPGNWREYASLGLAYMAKARVTADPGWYARAEGALRASLRLRDEDNGDAILGLGALALARHNFGQALAHGRAVRALNPYDADADAVIGDALIELGRYDEAFETLQRMVDARPDLASYARASYARQLLGDVAGAIDAMGRAFGAAGTPADAAWAAHQLGQLEVGRGRVAASAAWFERGLELDPASVQNLAGMARVAWARGDVGLAIARYREVVARYPAVEYAAALGDLYAAIGEEELAAEQYAVVDASRELAEANGVNVDLEVALFDADHGHARSALAAARAEWSRRRSVQVADAYAWALYANGRYREAADVMDVALSLETRDATFLFHAGMIERALGRAAIAREHLREALALDPAFSILHAATAERVLAELEAER
jgi:tetratricopeptide (TPR) repeat protein